MSKISIIFSTLNEEYNYLFFDALTRYSEIDEVEIICVDGGSTDKTIEKINEFGKIKVFEGDINSRAERYNKGLKVVKSDLIILHHPRSIIEKSGIEFLIHNLNEITWGGFTHKFDRQNFMLKFTSWYSNYIRVKLKSIVYLDHCIFINRKNILLEEIPNLEIFEDTVLSYNLRVQKKATLLKFISLTSSIRFIKKGIIKQALLNQLLKLMFFLKTPDIYMNKIYEKGLNLNKKKIKN